MRLHSADHMKSPTSPLPDSPDILVIPYGSTNRDFPSVAAGNLAAAWQIPVIDLNTRPGNILERLPESCQTVGFVAQSRCAAEMEYMVSLLRRHRPDISWATANGPVDVQCCYPFLRTSLCFSHGVNFDDNIPFPRYELFDTFPIFSENWQTGKWFYPLMTSLGCPFGCSYCACRRRSVQFRSISHCLKELEIAKREWKIKQFMVIDDCFNADPNRAGEFSKAVSRLGLTWMASNGLRADYFDEELGNFMYQSGCRRVAFGLESTDDTVLTRIGKGEDFDKIRTAVLKAKEIFDFVNVFLILGLPGSSYETDRKSIEWVKKHDLGVHVSFYLPFDQGMRKNFLFDRPEGRPLSDAYAPELQIKLFQMAQR